MIPLKNYSFNVMKKYFTKEKLKFNMQLEALSNEIERLITDYSFVNEPTVIKYNPKVFAYIMKDQSYLNQTGEIGHYRGIRIILDDNVDTYEIIYR